MARSLLNHSQSYRLTRWMDTESMKTAAVESTDEAIARQASKELGFSCSANNIASVRRTLGLRKRAETPPSAPTPDQAALEELLNEQNNRIHALEHNVQALLDRVTGIENNPVIKFRRTP